MEGGILRTDFDGGIPALKRKSFVVITKVELLKVLCKFV